MCLYCKLVVQDDKCTVAMLQSVGNAKRRPHYDDFGMLKEKKLLRQVSDDDDR